MQSIIKRIHTLQAKLYDNLSTTEAKHAQGQLTGYAAILEQEELPISEGMLQNIMDDVRELESACVVEALAF